MPLSTQKNIHHLPDHRSIALILMSGFITLLFFKNSDAAAGFILRGLEICAKRLIPSLFPFLVVSSLLVYSGLDIYLGKTLCRPLGIILGVNNEAACAVLLGFICGFPVGARCACGLFDEGRIERQELTRILTVCSVPSPTFLVSVVGEGMLGLSRAGWKLYGICVFSALAVGIFLRIFAPLSRKSPYMPTEQRTARRSISSALTRAVCDGGNSMLSICAFVIFFSAFLGALEACLSPLEVSEEGRALLFAFFELTSGEARIAALSPPLRFPLCALAAGWAGLSVHFQTMAICGSTPVRFAPYILSHAARALLGFVIALLFIRI